MEPAAWVGILLVICGGAMEGTFSLPMRFTPQWKWENIWEAGSFAALVLVPWPLALLTVPHIWGVYRAASSATLLIVVIFGFGWALGSIFYGLGVAALGFSVGLSLIMGLIAIGGSVIPLAIRHPEQFGQRTGMVLLAGIVVMSAGMALCAAAGSMKEYFASAGVTRRPAGNFRRGFMFCVLCGVLSTFVNFALIFGDDLATSARRAGANPAGAANSIWALVFTVNYLVNIGYCLYLNRKNATFGRLFAPGVLLYWVGAVAMGLVWAGGIVVYGIGAQRMGAFGTYFGFPVMLISSVLAGNAIGVLAGEWRGVETKPKLIMTAGVALLVAAIAVLACSKQISRAPEETLMKRPATVGTAGLSFSEILHRSIGCPVPWT